MRVECRALDEQNIADMEYVIIGAYYNCRWLFVRHEKRQTWEMPAGHIEMDERPLEAAKRELYEETGAVDFEIEPLFDYRVIDQKTNQSIGSGRVYFAKILELGKLPAYEIAEVKAFNDMPSELTYTQIQPILFERVRTMQQL